MKVGNVVIFYWIFYLFTFQMLFSFPVSPSELPYSILPLSASMRVLTHPLPLPCPDIPLHWGIKPSQDQGPLLPLMPGKVILCYICGWSHGSFHVYSLAGGLVPGSAGGTGLFILLFFLWDCKPLQLFGFFP